MNSVSGAAILVAKLPVMENTKMIMNSCQLEFIPHRSLSFSIKASVYIFAENI